MLVLGGVDPVSGSILVAAITVVIAQVGLVTKGRRDASATERAAKSAAKATEAAATATASAAMVETAFNGMQAQVATATEAWRDCEGRCDQLGAENTELRSEVKQLRQALDRVTRDMNNLIAKHGDAT
ncbi:MAG: hypothetical protein JWM89_1792 [Acidimicrobiales bacterium]|nr:hypothetical protein [Acidimicrobiales bacterium]